MATIISTPPDAIPSDLSEIQAIECLTLTLAPLDPSQYSSGNGGTTGAPRTIQLSAGTTEDARRENAQAFYEPAEALLASCSQTIESMEAKYEGLIKHFYVDPHGEHPSEEVRQLAGDLEHRLLQYVEGMRKTLKQAMKQPENLTYAVVINRHALNLHIVGVLLRFVDNLASQIGQVERGDETELKRISMEAIEEANGSKWPRLCCRRTSLE